MKMPKMIKKSEPVPALQHSQEELATIAQRHGITLIVLFGSHSRGFARADSDVDLAFEFQPRRKMVYERLWEDLIPLIGTDQLDLVDLGKAPPLLAWCAATTGIALYDRNGERWNRFRKRAVKEYEDVRHFDRYRLRSIEEFLKRPAS